MAGERKPRRSVAGASKGAARVAAVVTAAAAPPTELSVLEHVARIRTTRAESLAEASQPSPRGRTVSGARPLVRGGQGGSASRIQAAVRGRQTRLALHLRAGSRVAVRLRDFAIDGADAPAGTVRWRGQLRGVAGQGDFLGIELDQPLGKHDGMLEGVRYFAGKDGHCVFVRPSAARALPAVDRRASDAMAAAAPASR